ncbi:MAG: erythromycin esterase family protein [Pyrinomonadaceae bacterium]|nr:erythromycin esterase family protein [Sphingobacteriaceae bacterium]
MKLLLLYLFILFQITAFAQIKTALNLGFETEKSNGEPYSWLFNKDQGAGVACDNLYSFKGLKSLYVDARKITLPTYLVYNYLPGKYLKGKHSIRITAFIKTDSITQSISFLMNQQGAGSVYKATKYSDSTFSNGWKRYSVQSLVDTTAEHVLFGFSLPKGNYWIDNVRIELDESVVNDEAPILVQLPSVSDIEWLKKNSTEINLNSSAGLTQKEIFRISKSLTKTKILALGEATHGTHEFFDVKIRLIKSLVEDYKFNVIAFEAPMDELYEVNKYIIEGKGRISAVVQGRAFYRVYDTQEVQELIEWLKNENLSRSKENKIYFAGIDMQGGTQAYKNIQEYLTADTVLSKRFQSVYTAFLKPKTKLIERERFCNMVDTFYNTFHTNKPILSKTGGLDSKWIEQNIELIRQSAKKQYDDALGRGLTRDSMMAENALWLSKYYPDSKIILWGHNAHIYNQTKYMGAYLYQKLGEKYFAIGLTTANGVFNVFPNSGTTTYPLVPPTKETFEYYFSNIDKPAFIFPTHGAREKLNSFSQLAFRSVGAAATNHQFHHLDKNLLELFDAIIFIKDTTPSKARLKNKL